jgi:hypothetical protein
MKDVDSQGVPVVTAQVFITHSGTDITLGFKVIFHTILAVGVIVKTSKLPYCTIIFRAIRYDFAKSRLCGSFFCSTLGMTLINICSLLREVTGKIIVFPCPYLHIWYRYLRIGKRVTVRLIATSKAGRNWFAQC